MTLISTCLQCGWADGGHAPDCPVWQAATEYEILKSQKDAILAKELARGDALMKQLEGTLMGKLRETEAERDQLRVDLAAARAALATERERIIKIIGDERLKAVQQGNATVVLYLDDVARQVSP